MKFDAYTMGFSNRSWDETLAPVLEIDPGDVVSAETDDFARNSLAGTDS